MGMAGFVRRLSALSVTCLVSGVFLVSPSTVAAAQPATPPQDPAEVPLQSPEGLRNGESGAPPSTGESVEPVASPTQSAAPEDVVPPADAPGDDPSTAVPEPTEAATPTTEEPATPAESTQPERAETPVEPTEEIAPDLLGGEAEAQPAAPAPAGPPTLRPRVEDPGAREAALRRAWEEQVRPSGNPGRFSLGVRALFANAGGGDHVGGRLGGAQVDVGQAWNNFGYALTASAWGGRVLLPYETNAEMNAMFGAGPTVHLGRRAIVGRGFLDLRLGYDFFYGVVNRRDDRPTIVAPQADPDVQFVQADNLAPHGPRVSLGMGLMGGGQNWRKYLHGFGMTVGYQGLVGSFNGDLPFTHMLTMGFAYWMG